MVIWMVEDELQNCGGHLEARVYQTSDIISIVLRTEDMILQQNDIFLISAQLPRWRKLQPGVGKLLIGFRV